jgi:two-component system response regulator AgrA
MTNFIICDDEELIRKKISKVISRLMMPLDIEYKTFEFSSYTKEFFHLLNKKVGNKIYILDVEVSNKSGLDVARKIRENDWQSIIIILTAHYELAYDAFKERLMLLDFISKFDNYEKNVYDTLKVALKIYDSKPALCIDFNRVSYRIEYDDILYIVKDEKERKIKIKTYYTEYIITMNLNEVIEKLDSRFCRTHRACIVNKNNIKGIDSKSSKIIFKNNEEVCLLSKNYKKGVKEYVFN